MTASRAEERSLGRRPGSPDTRGQIVAAARQEFAGKGFDKTSLRGVARAAGVDPSLVHHYFGSKEDLFLVAMQLPFDPREVLPSALAGPLEGLGERLVATVLQLWDDAERRPALLAVFRSAMASEETTHLLRDGFLRMIVQQIAHVPGLDDAERRAALCASQLVGLIVIRYVVRLEPVASLPASELARWVGPAVQHHLTGT